jgi:hypothetical protein
MTVLFGLRAADETDKATSAQHSALRARTQCALSEVTPESLVPPAGMHQALRARVGESLRGRLPNTTDAALIYMLGAVSETHYYSDTELPIWQESNFFYFTGYGQVAHKERKERMNGHQGIALFFA